MGFSIISAAGFAYLVIMAIIGHFLPIPDFTMSILAQPGLIIIPYLTGRPILFVCKKFLSLININDFLLESTVSWAIGALFIVVLESLLYVNYTFSLSFTSPFMLIIALLCVAAVFIKGKAHNETIRQKELGLAILYGLAFSIASVYLLAYPLTQDSDTFHHAYFTLNILTDSRPLLFSPSYLPTMSTLYAMLMQIFGVGADAGGALTTLWTSRFILYPVYAGGLYLVTYQFTKNKVMALLTAIIGCSLINSDGSIFPYDTVPKSLVNILFVFGLYTGLKLEEGGEKKHFILNLAGLAVLATAFFLPLFLTVSAPSSLLGYELAYVLAGILLVMIIVPRFINFRNRQTFFYILITLTAIIFMTKLQGFIGCLIIVFLLLVARALNSLSPRVIRTVGFAILGILAAYLLLSYFNVIPYPDYPIRLWFMNPDAYLPYNFGLENLLNYINSTYPVIIFVLAMAGGILSLIMLKQENKRTAGITILATLLLLVYFLPVTHSYRFLGNVHPFLIMLAVLAIIALTQIKRLRLWLSWTVVAVIMATTFGFVYFHDIEQVRADDITKDYETFQVIEIGEFLKNNTDPDAAIVGCWWYQESAAHYAGRNFVRLWDEGERQDDVIKDIYLSDTSEEAYNKLKALLSNENNFITSPDKDGKDVARFYQEPTELILLYDEILAQWLGDEDSIYKFFNDRFFATEFKIENPTYGGYHYVFKANAELLPPEENEGTPLVNLVSNGSFEDGWDDAKACPLAWEQLWKMDWVGSLDSENMFSGNFCFRMETPITEENKWGTLKCDDIPVEKGKIYLVNVSVKTQNAIKTYIEIDHYDEGHKVIDLIRAHEANQEWTTYTNYIKIPEDVTDIRILLMAGWVAEPTEGNGFIWFDDIAVFGPIEQ